MAEKNIKQKFSRNNEKATWEDTRKEQPYLMPGSPEYEEYTKDLKEHDPFKPDDEFHAEETKLNEEYPEEIKAQYSGEESRQVQVKKIRNQMLKDTQYSELKKSAMYQAELTEEKDDDERARKLKRSAIEGVVYDDGVTEDEYIPHVLKKYL